MHIQPFDPAAEPGKVRAFYEIYATGVPIDDPDGPPWSPRLYSSWIRQGWAGEPRRTALAIDDGGTPVGAYLVELPQQRNKHLGWLALMVAPAQRRHGTGRELLRHAALCAAQEGLTTLTTEVRCDTPGAAFAGAVGARAGLLEIRRVLELATVPDGHLASLRRRAEAASAGYSLLSWTGPVPEEYLQDVARVFTAMNDAPHNEGRETREPDTEHIRRSEHFHGELGTRRYSVAARCDRTGEIVAITQIAVDPDDPEWGYQLTTAVARSHRGHRLGLLVKTVMVEQLISAEPTIRHFITGNAGLNKHMIAINADLGFTVLDQWQTFDFDVASAPPTR
jgi:GNAT superfamily N-acetyltransferase